MRCLSLWLVQWLSLTNTFKKMRRRDLSIFTARVWPCSYLTVYFARSFQCSRCLLPSSTQFKKMTSYPSYQWNESKQLTISFPINASVNSKRQHPWAIPRKFFEVVKSPFTGQNFSARITAPIQGKIFLQESRPLGLNSTYLRGTFQKI